MTELLQVLRVLPGAAVVGSLTLLIGFLLAFVVAVGWTAVSARRTSARPTRSGLSLRVSTLLYA